MGLDGSLSNLNSKFLCLYQGRLGIGCHPWLRPSRSPSTSLSHHRLSIQEHLEVISDHYISPRAPALHFYRASRPAFTRKPREAREKIDSHNEVKVNLSDLQITCVNSGSSHHSRSPHVWRRRHPF